MRLLEELTLVDAQHAGRSYAAQASFSSRQDTPHDMDLTFSLEWPPMAPAIRDRLK